jgi:hypothetical protein
LRALRLCSRGVRGSAGKQNASPAGSDSVRQPRLP